MIKSIIDKVTGWGYNTYIPIWAYKYLNSVIQTKGCEDVDKLTNLFKIMSDETRLRILVLLYHKKLCVCQMQGVLEESQPKISKHLAKLRDMGFVKDERREQFIYYYLDDKNTLLREILEKIIMNIEEFETIQNDLKELEKAEEYITSCKNQ